MAALSVLDLSFVSDIAPPSVALNQSVDLARLADDLGYVRYWVAEHHALASVASSAPEVIIARLASATKRIRVGAGGVMLPNHAPLMVAERFKTLEAFFPDRIDLGLGRAPGTDGVTAFALRRRMDVRAGDEFLERLQELFAWDEHSFPEGHHFQKIIAMPDDTPLPAVFLLGSSDYSAKLAAKLGLGFAFAHHFAQFDARAAMLGYRQTFQPSQKLQKPHAILAVSAILADSQEEAEHLASSADLGSLRRARGEYKILSSPAEALAYPYSAEERAFIAHNRQRLLVGDAATVKSALDRLVAETKADEIMIGSPIYDQAARKYSYALLADVYRSGAAL